MKKVLTFLSALAVLSVIAIPALADTNIYLSSHRNSSRHFQSNDWHGHRYAYPRYNYHHRNQRRIVMPIYAPNFFPQPERHIVVEKRIVQYVPMEAPLQATAVSASYVDVSGQYCREYQAPANLNGFSGDVYGTACRQPDGSWRVVN